MEKSSVADGWDRMVEAWLAKVELDNGSLQLGRLSS